MNYLYIFTYIILLFSSSGQDHFLKARQMFKSGELDSAHYYFTKALEENPEYDEAYFWRAIVNQEMGDPKLAIKDYTKAIEINPIAKYINNRGMSYMILEDLENAMENFDQALKVDPGYSKAWFNKGHLYQRLGENDKACDCFNKAYDNGLDLALQFIEQTCS